MTLIDPIIDKDQLGFGLSIEERKALMLHSIDLLKLIETETQESIARLQKLSDKGRGIL